MKAKEKDKKITNKDKILELKKSIKEEKKKIKKEKKSIRKIRKEEFKKTKLGKFVNKVFFFFNDEKDSYSFSELFGATLISLILGFFVCFCVFTILSGGRNYFKMSKQLDKFYDVYDVLVDNYNGNIDKDKLIESAINGMVQSVGDVYTSYSDINNTDSFNELVNGTYEGIGCTIRQEEDKISVVEVYDDTPASKVGIKSGDIVKTVDGNDALGMGATELANYIKNEAKGKIKITILRGEEELSFELERGKVEIPSVTSKIYEKNGKKVGYIDIDIFSSVANKQFESKLKELENKKIDSLVIDVRDNNGGYLSVVTDIVGNLLPKGEVIYKVQRGKKTRVTKDKTNTKREYPIAVITNSGSASASEILAAAIKESYHGYVVGTKTYGKGTVQQVKQLSDGSMVKYTIENWLTPLGNWINDKGIEPTDEVIIDEKYYETLSSEDDNQLQKALELVSK